MPKSPHGPRNWRLHSDPVENEERAIARHTPLSLLLDDPKVEVLSAENTKAPEVIIFRGLGWVAEGALLSPQPATSISASWSWFDAAVLAMLDRSHFTYLCYTPEVAPEARDRAYAVGQQRFAAWRGAIARLLKASGRSVPWPLADSERVDGLASSGSPAAASSGPEADPPPLRPSGIC